MSIKRQNDTPFWWYRDTTVAHTAVISRALITHALSPIAWVYAAIAARRLQQPPAYRSKVPVLCVGNFTAGGTGKTPLVRAICDVLRAAGYTPVILSRGYGGTIKGPHRVTPSIDRARDVGDEPLMLAASYPVVVARDRAAGAKFIETDNKHITTTVIVLDDGLQNPSLHKDVRIAVVDRVRGIGNGRVIPAGPLRAPISAQLTNTDLIALVTPPDAPPAAPVPDFLAGCRSPAVEVSVAADRETPVHPDADVVAFAGIGAPERFFSLLEQRGAHIVAREVFPDHHAFSNTDAIRLMARAADLKATLITTEKDAARLANATGALATLAQQIRVIRITASLPAAAQTVLLERIEQRKQQR